MFVTLDTTSFTTQARRFWKSPIGMSPSKSGVSMSPNETMNLHAVIDDNSLLCLQILNKIGRACRLICSLNTSHWQNGYRIVLWISYEFEVMSEVAEMLFVKYKCIECGIHLYKCEACKEYFFVRKMHYCYFERRYLLQELFPPDKGFDKKSQALVVDCACMHPCTHRHLIKVKAS